MDDVQSGIFVAWGLESAITGRVFFAFDHYIVKRLLNVSGVDVSVPDAISVIMVCRCFREWRITYFEFYAREMEDCSIIAFLDNLGSASSGGNLEELGTQSTMVYHHQTQIPLLYGMESNVTLSVPAEEPQETREKRREI
ncbi:hypothetical protein M422DRAFT_262018 [Sphaerobolus stellatus SS14]|uniref:Unplaced genomic scaffold SPHSTscaffold_111, whole genome shotgun sequence n=1 Tax=Sphaerobolus stellatus (strain SS14) TaxID=990650 RepID=A0A0C9VDF3_SPHS4|nr:hypothetical protein M422DRAFT_262018 [Sphaerobolus stellatus SS14]